MSNPYRPDESSSYGSPGSAGYPTPPATDAPVDAGYAPPSPYQSASPYQSTSPYATSPYAGSPYASAVPQQNQLALIALICSLASLVTGISALAGIICGHIALSQIRRQPQQQGRGMAIAALWVGYGLLVAWLALVVLWIVWFTVLINTGSSY